MRRLLRDRAARMVAAVLAYVALAVVALAAVTWFSLLPDQRRQLADALTGQVATFVLGGLAAGAGLTWLLLHGPAAYPRRVRRMTADVALVAANPGHRLPVDGPPELAELADAVNALADRVAGADRDREDAVEAARRDADRDRARLAAVLADLTVPVLVCSPGGRVQLSNAAARAVLGDAVALGRSLAPLLDLDAVPGDDPAELRCTAPDGVVLTARVAPVRDHDGDGATGFVVVLDAPVVAVPQVVLGSRPEFYDFDLPDLPPGADADRPLRDLAFTVLDTETTGFDADGGDEVVQVGAVHVVGGRVRRHEVLDRLVDPRRRVPATATAVHGIDDAAVSGAPVLEEVLAELARFAADRVLVGHNVAFDLSFLRRRDATGVTAQPALDTLLLDAVAHPDHDDHGLDAVARRLGVEVSDRHSALGDALVTAEVLVRLLPLLEARGVTTLGQALEACRRVARQRSGAT